MSNFVFILFLRNTQFLLKAPSVSKTNNLPQKKQKHVVLFLFVCCFFKYPWHTLHTHRQCVHAKLTLFLTCHPLSCLVWSETLIDKNNTAELKDTSMDTSVLSTPECELYVRVQNRYDLSTISFSAPQSLTSIELWRLVYSTISVTCSTISQSFAPAFLSLFKISK